VLALSTAGSSASARLTARFGPPTAHASARLSLPRKLKGPIMASTPSGIWGMSDQYVLADGPRRSATAPST
jgi:hypothetical protein